MITELVLTVTAVLAVGAILAYWGREKLGSRRRRSRLLARFDEVTGETDTLALRLDSTVWILRRDVELVRGAFAPEEVPAVLGTCEERLAAADELLRQRSDLSEDTGASLSDRSSEAIARAVESWRELDRALRALLPELQAEEERLSVALSMGERVAERMDRARRRADEVRATSDALGAEGFVVTTERRCADSAAERVAAAERLAEENRLHAADAALTELIDDLTTSRESLGTLRRRHSDLESRLTDLDEAVSVTDRRVGEAEEHREILTRDHAPGIWADLAESIERGRSRLDRAREELSHAGDALRRGDVARGEERAEAASSALSEAGESLDVPLGRLANVRELSRTLPSTKEKVLARVVTLERNAESNETTRPMADVAALLRGQLDQLDMAAERPDWLLFERRIAEIDVLVTTIDGALRHGVEAITRASDDARRWKSALAAERTAREQAEKELAWYLDRPFRRES